MGKRSSVEPVPGWVVEWCLGVAHSRAQRAGLGVGGGFGDGIGDGLELEVGKCSREGSWPVGLGGFTRRVAESQQHAVFAALRAT